MSTPIYTTSSLTSNTGFGLAGFNEQQYKAALVYYKMMELYAIGGTDYRDSTGTTMVMDAINLAGEMNPNQRRIAALQIAYNNAIAAGASVPSTLSELNALTVSLQGYVDLDSLLLTLDSQLGVSTAQWFSSDGFDPVLGPPYPPDLYQLFMNRLTGELTWTVPDVFVETSVHIVGGNTNVHIEITNYTWPVWSNAVTYGLNSRVMYPSGAPVGQPYLSLQNNNLNHAPNASPTFWEADPTVFKVWQRSVNTVTGEIVDFEIVADSNGDDYGPIYNFSFGTTATFILTFVGSGPAEAYDFFFYLEAVTGSTHIYSPIQKITLTL